MGGLGLISMTFSQRSHTDLPVELGIIKKIFFTILIPIQVLLKWYQNHSIVWCFSQYLKKVMSTDTQSNEIPGLFFQLWWRVKHNGVQKMWTWRVEGTKYHFWRLSRRRVDLSSPLRHGPIYVHPPNFSTEALAPLYTPLALILLFWDTSVAALACGRNHKS